jgi:hypothetical protein
MSNVKLFCCTNQGTVRLNFVSGLEVRMFSSTPLGGFLGEVYAGAYPELKEPESAIALATLLLAEESITHEQALLVELRRVLAQLYGDMGTWRCRERQPNERICLALRQVSTAMMVSGFSLSTAYLSGLLGIRETTAIFKGEGKFWHVYNRGLRIFHAQHFPLNPIGRHQFFGLVGLKGSGKSSLLHLLQEDGEDILEIYRDLDRIRSEDQDAYSKLPSRINWEDEPLRLVPPYQKIA